MTQFDLKGMDKAIERMKALPNDVRKKVVMGALRKSATLVVKAAKANAMRARMRMVARQASLDPGDGIEL